MKLPSRETGLVLFWVGLGLMVLGVVDLFILFSEGVGETILGQIIRVLAGKNITVYRIVATVLMMVSPVLLAFGGGSI